MSLQDYIQPWNGYAVRHIPDRPTQPYNIYDFSYCGVSNENRWNVAGEATLYLAKEKDVALDDLEQWCLVLFLEKLPSNPHEFLPAVSPDGAFEIS
jgi:hypothetical protein